MKLTRLLWVGLIGLLGAQCTSSNLGQPIVSTHTAEAGQAQIQPLSSPTSIGPIPSSTVIVPKGSTWKYLDNGADQGIAWRLPEFDDSQWSQGWAKFGYGDDGMRTSVSYGSDPENKYVTTYFRKSFNISNAARPQILTLSILRDDGAVVYLNGVEVYRTNMPRGEITDTTLASEVIDDADEMKFYNVNIDSKLLVSGTNVLAVEVHQTNRNSSDLRFDLELVGSTFLPVPTGAFKEGWGLVFDDEFEGTRLDTDKWHTELRWGRSNPPEAQYYASDAFKLQRGLLRLKAEKRSMEDHTYTSGIIASFDRFMFTYGYVEIRARVPKGQGLWPALWLLADNDNSSAEIDMIEILGHEPQRVYTTLHYDDAKGKSQDDGQVYEGLDFSQDFHTFAVDWSPTAVIWFVDGVERFRLTQHVPQEPMYLLANLAVGGEWPGYPDQTTHFPAYFEIDYIRVYQQE
jgi:hypothetical protein